MCLYVRTCVCFYVENVLSLHVCACATEKCKQTDYHAIQRINNPQQLRCTPCSLILLAPHMELFYPHPALPQRYFCTTSPKLIHTHIHKTASVSSPSRRPNVNEHRVITVVFWNSHTFSPVTGIFISTQKNCLS